MVIHDQNAHRFAILELSPTRTGIMGQGRRPRNDDWRLTGAAPNPRFPAVGSSFMWRQIALRHRLNMLFGALLLLWLLVDVGRILIDAGPRARDEEQSMTRLTSQFVATALSDAQEAADPERALAARVASLQNLRHVRVMQSEDDAFSPALVAAEDARSGAPAWFRRMVGAKLYVSAIPVVLQGRRHGSIFIVADPSDEIDEIWSAARTQALAGGALALVVILAGSLFIRRALKPLDSW